MTVRDLEYVESELINRIESSIPQMVQFSYELENNALSNAAAQAEQEEAKKRGEVGLGTVITSNILIWD